MPPILSPLMLARVVPSARYWEAVDQLERQGLDRAAARRAADRLEPPTVPADAVVRRLLAWTAPKENP